MIKNTLIKNNNTDSTLSALPDGYLSLEQMYAAIGCNTVELVRLDDTRVLWCDENGLSVSNPKLNIPATQMYRAAYPHVPPQELGIVGYAILSVATEPGESPLEE